MGPGQRCGAAPGASSLDVFSQKLIERIDGGLLRRGRPVAAAEDQRAGPTRRQGHHHRGVGEAVVVGVGDRQMRGGGAVVGEQRAVPLIEQRSMPGLGRVALDQQERPVEPG